MKVSRKSWHYRLWKLGRMQSSEPRDLCRYFWHIVLIKLAFPITVAALIVVIIGAIVVVIIQNPIETAITVSLVACLAAFIVGIVLLAGWQKNKPKIPKQPKQPREPGLTRQYLKARKRKMCPLIEVVDGGGDERA